MKKKRLSLKTGFYFVGAIFLLWLQYSSSVLLCCVRVLRDSICFQCCSLEKQRQLTVLLLGCDGLCAAGCRCRAERAPDASHSGRLQPHGGLRAAAGRAHHQPVLLGLSHGREEEPAVAGPQQHCALHRALAHQPRLHDLQRRLQGPLLVPPHHHGLSTERLGFLYFIFSRHDCTLSPERRRQEVGPSCHGNLSGALLYFW